MPPNRLWVVVAGYTALLVGAQMSIAADSSVSQYTSSYYYVSNGEGGARKVEADPAKAAPDWWYVYFYKKGEVADGSKKGRWGADSERTLPELLAYVKRIQEAELNDKYPNPKVVCTWLNAFYPVAYYYKTSSDSGKDKRANPKTSTEAASKPNDNGTGADKIPWPQQRTRYEWVLTRADNLRTTYDLIRQMSSSGASENNPFRNVGTVLMDYLDTTKFALDRAEEVRRQILAGVTPAQDELNTMLDQITASLDKSRNSFGTLQNSTPDFFAHSVAGAAAPATDKTPGTASADDDARQLEALNQQLIEASTKFDPTNMNAALARINTIARQMVQLLKKTPDMDPKLCRAWQAMVEITDAKNSATPETKFQEMLEKMMDLTK